MSVRDEPTYARLVTDGDEMRFTIAALVVIIAATAALAGSVPVSNGDFEKGLEGWTERVNDR